MELPDPVFEIVVPFLSVVILIGLGWSIIRSRRELMDRFIYVLCGQVVLDYLEVQVILGANFPMGNTVAKRADLRVVSEIATATGLSETRVRSCLRQLARRGLVEAGWPDQWRLIRYEQALPL